MGAQRVVAKNGGHGVQHRRRTAEQLRQRQLGAHGAAHANGFARFKKQVQPQLAHPEGAAHDAEGITINVNAHAGGNVVALCFDQHFFAHDHAGIQRAPVHARPAGFVQQPANEQGIGAQHGLLKTRSHVAQDGASHVLAHTDIGHSHRPGVEHHPHRQTVDEQRGLFVHAKDILKTQIDRKPGFFVLFAGR